MDHDRALAIHAVERYLLGELSPGDSDEFERHFFTCAECASAVENGQEFIRALRDLPPGTGN
ncbi:MAG: zf-HC2 domain-containing protein [Acidobacteriaceae bacterium]|nr:zf-HC2 domain-containing protein [Acidobacteriaceae bacterium]